MLVVGTRDLSWTTELFLLGCSRKNLGDRSRKKLDGEKGGYLLILDSHYRERWKMLGVCDLDNYESQHR